MVWFKTAQVTILARKTILLRARISSFGLECNRETFLRHLVSSFHYVFKKRETGNIFNSVSATHYVNLNNLPSDCLHGTSSG